MKPEHERIVRAFKESITERFGGRVEKVIVFGSAARGEMGEESDIDVLVVVDRIDEKIESKIGDMAFEAGAEDRVLITPIVIGKGTYEDMLRERYPFIMNVEREGVAIA